MTCAARMWNILPVPGGWKSLEDHKTKEGAAFMKIIDAHSHILTPDYLAYVKENGAALEDGFALPNWSAEEHLDLMEQCGIEWSLLSVSSPHPPLWK